MNFVFCNHFVTKCKLFFDKEKARFLTACCAVFILGLIAHAYGFLNLTISHDSLFELCLSKSYINFRITLGRFMGPLYQFIFHGVVSLPWLNGLLALCWLSISVWMTAYMFSVTDKLRIVMIAGIFSVNITLVALTATYIHDLDTDIFGMMMAVGAAILWKKGGRVVWLGIPLLVLALASYQSVISVTISLVMFSSILALLQGKKASDVVRRGLQMIGIILIAGIIYFLIVKVSCLIAGVDIASSYNGLTNTYDRSWEIRHNIQVLEKTYDSWFLVFLKSYRPWGGMIAMHILLVTPSIVAVIYAMMKKTLLIQNKMLILGLMALLPLGMNISCFLSNGMVHELMFYAAWLSYLLAILISDWYTSSVEKHKILSKLCSTVTISMLFLIFAANVQTANAAYVKKDLERQATLAFMTTINADMNKTPGYVAGETKVVFIGNPQISTDVNRCFGRLTDILFFDKNSPITYNETYMAYFKYILQTPLLLQSQKKVPKQFANSMNIFPVNGYIQWYNGMLVVKLSEQSDEYEEQCYYE